MNEHTETCELLVTHDGPCSTVAEFEERLRMMGQPHQAAPDARAQNAGYNRGWIDGKRAAEFQIDPRVDRLEGDLDALRVAGLFLCAAIIGVALGVLNRKDHHDLP